MTREPHDNRYHQARGLWQRRLQERTPEDVYPSTEEWIAFNAGWDLRFEMALIGTRADARDDNEVRLIRDQINFLIQEYQRAWDEYFKGSELRRRQSRLIAQLQSMIRERGQAPEEAPAWRRISEQRKEIKRLTKLVDTLRGRNADD